MGLRGKLFLSLLLSSLMLTWYVYGFWMPRLLAGAEKRYQSLTATHLDSVGESLVPLMLGRQLDAVYGNLDALLRKNRDWVSIQLFDPDGRSLYPLGASPASKNKTGRDIRTLRQDILYLETNLGSLVVKIDFAPILNEIRSRNIGLLYMFLCAILLFLITSGFILEHVVRRPVRLLADASKRLAEGNFGTPLPKTASDEIGILIESFAAMRDSLRLHADGLADANARLRSEIGERWRAEEKLRISAEEWHSTFDAISDGVSIHDNEMTIVKANKSLGDFLGIPSEDLLGRKCHKVFHNSDEPRHDCPLRRAMNSEKPEFLEFLEPVFSRWLSVSCFPIFEAGKEITGTVHVVRDITDRKRTEDDIRRLNEELEQKIQERTKELLEAQEELVRKEKLATLGQLSGSVGHEIRNPLGVINNAIYFLKTVIPETEETVQEYLGIIKAEVDNSRRIISDLLDFSRTKTPQATAMPAGELIRQALGKCSIPGGVEVRLDIPETLPSTRVDPFQMSQVCQNLITNAVQAMPKGGALTISAKAVQKCGSAEARKQEDSETSALPNFCTSDYRNFIEISVADTGEGIPSENISKIFQPLFSTKARGIGLGLVVCRNLVEANGGRIEVESEPGEGTTFRIILPAEEGEP